MTFWMLIKSIFLVCLCIHPIALGLLGLADFLTNARIDGLFAVAATPMTLAFFGPPALACCLLVIVPTYYLLSRYGRRDMVPFAVLAIGAGIVLYLSLTDRASSEAISGYDQAAQGFSAVSLIAWAVYAFLRLGPRTR